MKDKIVLTRKINFTAKATNLENLERMMFIQKHISKEMNILMTRYYNFYMKARNKFIQTKEFELCEQNAEKYLKNANSEEVKQVIMEKSIKRFLNQKIFEGQNMFEKLFGRSLQNMGYRYLVEESIFANKELKKLLRFQVILLLE